MRGDQRLIDDDALAGLHLDDSPGEIVSRCRRRNGGFSSN